MARRRAVVAAALVLLALPAQAKKHAGAKKPADDAPVDVTPTIDDPCVAGSTASCAHALDPFYAALARADRKEKGAVVRITQLGDSITADDLIPGRAREVLQKRFGDGGAGFLFLASPHGVYHRTNAKVASRGWLMHSIIHGGKADGLYGLGGATFEGSGAETSVSTVSGDLGGAASHFELYYLAQPKGGTVELEVDGKVATSVDTQAASATSAWAAVDVADGAHTLTVHGTKGRVRAFGVVMERDQGVVYENLGLVSASARATSNNKAAHWREQLAHRKPDLVIVFYGANEAGWTGTSDDAIAAYEKTFGGLLASIRTARPDGACLVMSPLDAAEETDDGKLITKPALPKLVDAQHRAATAAGCAFLDTFAWMGGKGAMLKWAKQGLAGKDLTHISHRGARKVADALVGALLAGYDAYRKR